jgi:hypothetical protein
MGEVRLVYVVLLVYVASTLVCPSVFLVNSLQDQALRPGILASILAE